MGMVLRQGTALTIGQGTAAGPRARRPFLTARWANLCILSYAVPPELLLDRLPGGLRLDTLDGQAFVSLVAFQFLNTRVMGVRWPGHRDFIELNLRFYVRQGDERGVVFIREFIPLRLAAWMARAIYNEPYAVARLSCRISDEPAMLTAEYGLHWRGKAYGLSVTGDKPPITPAETSVEHFFKEHRWGYGCDRRGRCIRYEVIHPRWEVLPVRSWRLDLDWGEVYGPEWKLLNARPPYSVFLALGSAVEVFPKGVPGLNVNPPVVDVPLQE